MTEAATLTPEAGRAARANPRTNNLDFQGFDSVRVSILRPGISRSIENFPEIQTQRFLVCGFLVCGLAVAVAVKESPYGQLSRCQSGKKGPGPRDFELPKGVVRLR